MGLGPALEQPAEALLPVRLFMGPGQLGRGLGPGLGWPAEALLPVRLFTGRGSWAGARRSWAEGWGQARVAS